MSIIHYCYYKSILIVWIKKRMNQNIFQNDLIKTWKLLKKMIEKHCTPETKLVLGSKKTNVSPGKFYKTSCKAEVVKGEKFCAYFSIIFLDKDDKEIVRRVKWFNEISGKEKEYVIKCRALPRSEYAVIGYRGNTDGSNKSNLILKLSDPKKIQIHNIPDEEEEYDELYNYQLIWDRRKGVKKGEWEKIGLTKEQFETGSKTQFNILKKVGLQLDSRILDVGCGFGRSAYALFDFLNEDGYYYGIDIGEAGINYCKENYKKLNFHFIQNRNTDIPLNDIEFDYITFFSVFTHLYPPQIKSILKQCKSILSLNGLIIADIFERDDINDSMGSTGRMFYNRKFFRELLKSEGYELEVLEKQIWDSEKRTIFKIFHSK